MDYDKIIEILEEELKRYVRQIEGTNNWIKTVSQRIQLELQSLNPSFNSCGGLQGRLQA